MASDQGAPSCSYSFADLPGDLVRRIFAKAGDHHEAPLSVEDRLRAEATCRAWRRALRRLPYHSLDLLHPNDDAVAREAKKQWIVRVQPAATDFTVWDTPDQCTLALLSLDRQRLEELKVGVDRPPAVSPRVDIFSNLRTLSVWSSVWDPAWFKQLRQLRRLEWLQLWGVRPGGQPVRQPCVVSGLSALTYLHFHFYPPGPNESVPELCVDLATCPSLLELKLEGWSGSGIELQSVLHGPAGSLGPLLHGLRRLHLHYAQSTALDFAALPALTYLQLSNLSELLGAATIAGTISLRCLAVGRVWAYPLDPWVLELLQHSPPSLRSLHYCGDYPSTVADAVAGLTQLQALWFEEVDWEREADQPVQRPRDGPVWGRLRALGWACSVPLPEAARQATRLEVLHNFTPGLPRRRDLLLFSSLPALRHLRMAGFATEEEAGRMVETVHSLMPHLGTVELACRSEKAFAEASAGFLLD